MSKRVKLVVGLVAALLVGAVVYQTLQQSQQHYEVCVTFRGARHCATAAGRTPQEAIQAAHAIGCSRLTTGRDDNMVCMQTPPSSVRSLPSE